MVCCLAQNKEGSNPPHSRTCDDMPILEATLPQSAASLATPTRRSKRSVLVGVHAGCCKLADLYSVGVNKGAVADLPTCFQWQQHRSAQYWRQKRQLWFWLVLTRDDEGVAKLASCTSLAVVAGEGATVRDDAIVVVVCVYVGVSRLCHEHNQRKCLALHSKLGLPPSCCMLEIDRYNSRET